MESLKGESVRITTEDNLELHGILFEPKKETTNALIHVHGWVGNFYENKFIDYIAKEVVAKGISFLTFNNRGSGIVTDLIKRGKDKTEYVRIGGCLENFEDCTLDIRAAINLLDKRGYKKIILEGHSLGCQKITYYKYKTQDKRVKALVELAPVDDVGYSKRALGSRYEESLRVAKEMIENGKGNEPVPKWMEFYPLLSAKRFLDIADSKTSGGRVFDYSGELEEIKDADCPILAVFGSKDDYEVKAGEMLEVLKKSVKNCDVRLVRNANHGFIDFEPKLAKIVGDWIKKI
jgi:pimeloyl-ACP methyl ester carboxylesterase